MDRRVFKVASAAGLALALPALAQPANNQCSNATVLAGPGSIGGTTVNATNDGNPGCGNSSATPDVWYSITSPLRKQLVADTCGGAGWDTVVSIHRGCPGTPGATVLNCNDDACGLQSTVQATMEPGVTYLIRVGGYGGATGAFTLHVDLQDPPPPPTRGPDVIVGDLIDVGRYAALGGITSFAVGTTSCNIGDYPVQWTANDNHHPVIAQNMYRLKAGRLEQIGQSWVKHGFSSVNGNLCATCIQPPGGSTQLGVGCSDPYGSGLNGSQGGLGPRSEVNATTGVFRFPFGGRAVQNELDRRLQVATADIDPAQNAGALYWVEAQYVTQDDAQWNNGVNNASARRIAFASATSTPSFQGGTIRQKSALQVWRDTDPSVTIANADYADGDINARFEVAAKVVDNHDGTWSYTYAVRNMNSDRSGAGLLLPKHIGVVYSGVGFRDVASHSGEPFDGNDWVWGEGGDQAGWRVDKTFSQSANANALRWGTMYTFWFTTNTPPAPGTATIPLFKPGVGENATVNIPVPSGVPCTPDFNGDGFLDFFDYDAYVDCFEGNACPGGASADFNGDGFADFFDYSDFVAAYELGC